MRLPALTAVHVLALTALAAPAPAQQSSERPTVLREATPAGAARSAGLQGMEQIRVTARTVIVDRAALTRAGLDYVVLGPNLIRVRSTDRRGSDGGARIRIGTHGVEAFLSAVRRNRWVRSESTQQVLTTSGRAALVSSQNLAVGRRAARTTGPALAVIPTVLPDGRVRLDVSTGVEDRVTYAWGYGVDGSPASIATEIIAGDGEEVILGSSTTTTTTRESGLLSWGGGEQSRDVLIAVSADVVSR